VKFNYIPGQKLAKMKAVLPLKILFTLCALVQHQILLAVRCHEISKIYTQQEKVQITQVTK